MTALVATFVLVLGGRYTLDQAGWTEYAHIDVRLTGAVLLLVVLIVWRLHPVQVHRRFDVGSAPLWFAALIVWLGVSGLWSPPGARVSDRLIDLGVLLVLGLGTAALVASTPRRAATVLLWTGYSAGAIYATAGLVLQQTDVQGRLTVFGGGPNVFARVVGLGALFALFLAARHRRPLLLAALPPMIVAMMLSGSRGALVATAGCLVVFLLLFPRRCSIRGVAAGTVVGGVCVVVALTMFGDALAALVGQRLSTTEAGDDSGRSLLYQHAWQLFLDHPIAGAGLDSFWASDGRSVDISYPHNLMLEVGATGGLVAIGLTVAFVVSALRSAQPRSELSIERLGLFLAATFMLVSSMFSGDLYDSRYFWLFAIASAVRPPIRPSRPTAPRWSSTLDGLPQPATLD